jgi:hypothetical protein
MQTPDRSDPAANTIYPTTFYSSVKLLYSLYTLSNDYKSYSLSLLDNK